MSPTERPASRSLTTKALMTLASLAAACQGNIGPEGASPAPDAGSKPRDAAVRAEASSRAGPDGGDAGSFQPLAVAASVSKVKTLLTGLPPTPSEIAAVTADPSAIRGLVSQWVMTPQYQQKMLEFFEVAFQQNQSQINDFASQVDNNGGFSGGYNYNNLMLQNYHEMFARTALELIAEGKSFLETYTTTRFMLTPALAGGLAEMDSQHYDDNGDNDIDENFLYYPDNLRVQFVSTGPVPGVEAANPTSPSFMTFYSPSVSPSAGDPCLKDGFQYVPVKRYARDFSDTIFGALMGQGFLPSNHTVVSDPFTDAGVGYFDASTTPPGQCDDYVNTDSLSIADFSHWRMVNIRKPAAGENPTPLWDVDAMRSATELVFNIERVGFFTTPSFLASWNTNASNQARVTINQTLIVALNQIFNGNDGTKPLSTAAVDQEHLLPGCSACHTQLDPMRQFFRHDYTIPFHEQIDAGGLGLRDKDAGAGDPTIAPQFAWGGVSAQGASIADLGRLLSQQSAVGSAWAEKLCEWGNSAQCDPSDPEFQRIVTAFQTSNYSWTTLVTELFSSPIMTYASDTASTDQAGQVYAIARQSHLCGLLSNRLGITDICGLNPATSVPYQLRPAATIAAAYPSDQFARGTPGFVLANDPDLFTRASVENLCLSVAALVIDTTGSKYTSAQSEVAINDFVTNLMGLSGDRAAPMLQILSDHYADALAEPKGDAGTVTKTYALRSTFAVACMSPYVVGIGQ